MTGVTRIRLMSFKASAPSGSTTPTRPLKRQWIIGPIERYDRIMASEGGATRGTLRREHRVDLFWGSLYHLFFVVLHL